MGVEQILRDAFQAARDYRDARSRYEKDKSGIPPRIDLELEALVEILEGKRLIHCHSYRQDEILAVMRIAEDFGFRIAVFTHILEGYKVADVMARHGVAGSTFSDWWAYKLEVYDAIPYNGALMHEQGVLTTFNSDSDELARRLNLEGAKAVKYGNVSEEEALRFMTINGAKQLRVDRLVGSLEEGKDADFVIWSGHPLSTYTSCEQTWVDGRRYFDREEDRTMQAEVQRQRNALIQKALRTPRRPDAQPPKPPPSSKYSCKEVGR
jgi:imidazolonepropionase-like amidohydrolase